ncbi:hypothetical protein AUK22_03090 [bacterium CG2_30_54_10]|nr:MAG: hypothetical protein AUK22_03090 [bacterium CG2_30_54_10]
MKTELLRSFSFGTVNFDQAKAASQKAQEANRASESINKAGGIEKARMSQVFRQTSLEAGKTEGARFQARGEQVRTVSSQFSQAVRSENVNVNKKFIALIASPMNGTQPGVQLGGMLDVYG